MMRVKYTCTKMVALVYEATSLKISRICVMFYDHNSFVNNNMEPLILGHCVDFTFLLSCIQHLVHNHQISLRV